MPAVERENIQLTPEEIAAREIDNYLEKVEKQPEIGKDVSNVVQSAPAPQVGIAPVMDDKGQVVLSSVPSEPEIDLPLTEAEVRDGLHHKVIDAFRWLAEFCVYLIKKYPGRVFYKQQ